MPTRQSPDRYVRPPYVRPPYVRLGPQFQELPMSPLRAADFARAVKAYARAIDAKAAVFRLDPRI